MSDKRIWDHHQDGNRSHLTQGYPRQDILSKYISKNVPRGGSILEIGFGDGYLLNKNSINQYKVFGQDLSENNIEITKKQWNNKDIAFLLGDDSGKLLAEDNSIDGFVASEVLEHMTDEELIFCIKEIYRVLKKGGYAFITLPVKENLKLNECICPNCSTVFHKWGHKQYWDESKIQSTFSRLKILSTQEFFTRYVGNSVVEGDSWLCHVFIKINSRPYCSTGVKNISYCLTKVNMKPENIFSSSFFIVKNEERNFEIFLDYIKKVGDHLLDLGAGSQPYRETIEKANMRYSSVDIAGKQDYQLNLNTDIIPLESESIDGITFFQTLEHLSEPYHALDEAFRVLKSGGYAFISTPFLFALHGIPHDFYRYTEYFYHHVAEKYNIEIVSISSGVRGFGTIIYLFNHFVDYFSFFWPWKIFVSLPICLGNIVIWILEKLNLLIPRALRFSLSDRIVSDYVVIFRKK